MVFIIFLRKNGLYRLIVTPIPSKGFGLYDLTPYSKQNLFPFLTMSLSHYLYS